MEKKLLVRIDEDLHSQVKIVSIKRNIPLYKIIDELLRRWLEEIEDDKRGHKEE